MMMMRQSLQQYQDRPSRILEDFGFLLAVFLGAGYVVFAEILPAVGWSLGDCEHGHKFPWALVIILSVLVVPKTIGRATAGKLWEALARRLGGGNKK